jgi:anti-sigma regulatory factor (Ser/Thr protein kinase)
MTAPREVPAGELLLPHTPSSVYDARHAVRRDLAEHGIPAPVRDNTVLVLSEIVSNALKHARPLDSGKVALAWEVTDDGVRVAVSDGGSPTRPRPQPPSTSSTGGRGLGIVRDLTVAWGVEEEGSHTTVWAVVPRVVQLPPG